MQAAADGAASARWPRSSASTTTRSRSPAPGSTATCGWRTSTPRARSSSPASPDAVDAASAASPRTWAPRRCCPCAVSGAFHTPFMAPARDRLRRPRWPRPTCAHRDLPVVRQRRRPPPPGGDEWAGLLGAQLCSPVRWRQTLHHLAGRRRDTFVELGPGTVLTGMAKRTVSGARTLSVGTPAELDALLEALAVPAADAVGAHEGEHLFATERLVVSPAAGVFRQHRGRRSRNRAAAGDELGRDRRRPGALAVRRHPHGRARRRGRAGHRQPAPRLAPACGSTVATAPRHHRMGHRPPRQDRHQRRPRGPPRHHDAWISSAPASASDASAARTAGLAIEAGRPALDRAGIDPRPTSTW